jgi:allophanate hydrolase
LTVDDAFAALSVLAGPDCADPYSRPRPLGALAPMPAGMRLGVPLPGQRQFFGDMHSERAYEAALSRCMGLGAALIEIDMEPFYRAARLLYEGPWVAERYIAARRVIESAPQSMHPVTRQIILGGASASAIDTFAAFYELEELRRRCERALRQIDALALPTIPRAYTVDEVLADPIELNSRLGTYTNFVNLLDLCALAVPAAILPDGVPFGITLIGRAGDDAMLAAVGRRFHADTALALGAHSVLPGFAARSQVYAGCVNLPALAPRNDM